MRTLAIQTLDLDKAFSGGQGVHGLNLAVPSQAIYGFLGPNGAGKTTTIRILLSLLRPDRGEIRLFGERLATRERGALRHVGALVETPSLYRHLSGEKNLEVTRRLLDLPRARIGEVLERVDLLRAARQPVREYSLGMRQRLAIALALLSRPRLLILDEPSNGLDPAGIQDLRALLRDLVRDQEMTVFLSSHLLGEIEIVATHVGVLQAGRLLFQGELAALKQRVRPALRIVCPDAPRAAELIRGVGETDLEIRPDALLVQLQVLTPARLNRLLVEAGLEVSELTLSEPSLETLFFALTDSAAEVSRA